jgi:hypothetical protein
VSVYYKTDKRLYALKALRLRSHHDKVFSRLLGKAAVALPVALLIFKSLNIHSLKKSVAVSRACCK